MKHLEDLQQEDEYRNKIIYINAKFDVWYDVDFEDGNPFTFFEGTQEEFDKLCEKHKDLIAINPLVEINYLTEYELFPHRKPITKEQAARNRFLHFHSNKSNVQRKEAYRYLKSGY